MPLITSGPQIAALHDTMLDKFGGPPIGQPDASSDPTCVQHWAHANHHFNSSLWAEEDLARRTQVGDSEIATNKRAIDRFNQARNDAIERMDEILLAELGLIEPANAQNDAPAIRVPAGARLNSETAGSMIDRMSIMALKIHAMRLQTQREDVDDAHRANCQIKLEKLLEQREDLGRCLDELLADAQVGRAYFKIYRQFKMYNDPRFNPVLVAEQAHQTR
jgi:Protein of unknown function (DUF4254)